jgi:negative regulator of replication initiation
MKKSKPERKTIEQLKSGMAIKTFSLDTETIEYIEAKSKALDISASDYIRQLVKQDINLPDIAFGFEPGEALFRIYHNFVRALKRKRGEDVVVTAFKGFPESMDAAELAELFDNVEELLDVDLQYMEDKAHVREALDMVKIAREQNKLDEVYQKLHTYYIKRKAEQIH